MYLGSLQCRILSNVSLSFRLRLRNMSLPATVDSKRRVEDACIIGDVGVVGFTGEINQVSLLSFNKVRSLCCFRT